MCDFWGGMISGSHGHWPRRGRDIEETREALVLLEYGEFALQVQVIPGSYVNDSLHSDSRLQFRTDGTRRRAKPSVRQTARAQCDCPQALSKRLDYLSD